MSNEQRKPTILTLQDDVARQRPDLLRMQLQLEGYAQELLKLGVDVHTNLLPSIVAIGEQESGHKEFWSRNTLEKVGGNLGIDNFKTLGSFQINVYEVKRVLCQEPQVLQHINTLLQTHPVEGLSHITYPQHLTYWQLRNLVMNNIYAFYFVNHNLTRTVRNLQSKVREWGGACDPKDIIYTTHFVQNHTPQAMYSAIVLQNILQLARSGDDPIDLWDAVDKNYQDASFWSKVWWKDSGALTDVMDKSRIVLDGKYNEEFRALVQLLKERKGIDLRIETNKAGFVTAVNGVSVIDNEVLVDADKGFDVGALKQVFEGCHYTFYPLLSSDFAEKNKNRVHDDYNYAFRKYVSNISPEARAKRFAGEAQATELSTVVAECTGSIQYPSNQLEHGVQRDANNCKAMTGALDCISWIKYLFLDTSRISGSYSYLGQNEIDTYSYLGGVNEYHRIFAEKMDKNSIRMITPQTYQSDHYFQIISSVREGDVVGFGQELPQNCGGVSLAIQQPSPRKPVTQLDVSMSHGGVVTRVTNNNVWITMSNGEVDKGGVGVVEVPLFGPDGYYEAMCLSQLQKHDLRNYKPFVFFGSVDRAACESSLQERIDALGERTVELVEGVPVVQLDTYSVYHKSAGIDPISKKRTNYCSEIARTNQQKLLSGTAAKNKIKFTEAKQHIADIMNSGMKDGLYQYQQAWGGDTIEPIGYQLIQSGDDVISETSYSQIVESLDASKKDYKGLAPLVRDLYIDTKKGHRVTIVYGSYQGEIGYYVIDTLRGPAKRSGGGTGICSLYEYFTTPGFYMNDRESPCQKAFLRVEPVGIDMIQDQIPDLEMVPMNANDFTNIDGDAVQGDVIDITTEEDLEDEEVPGI